MQLFKIQAKLGGNDEGAECSNITLRRLLVWLEQPLERLKFLNVICDAVRGSLFFFYLVTNLKFFYIFVLN